MDIAEIREKRLKLATTITEMIECFRKETGLAVTGISVATHITRDSWASSVDLSLVTNIEIEKI